MHFGCDRRAEWINIFTREGAVSATPVAFLCHADDYNSVEKGTNMVFHQNF